MGEAKVLSTTSSAPIEREGHSASVVGSRVYIFGGTWVDDDSNSVYLNDLQVLDVAGGTGDIAFRIADDLAAGHASGGPAVRGRRARIVGG